MTIMLVWLTNIMSTLQESAPLWQIYMSLVQTLNLIKRTHSTETVIKLGDILKETKDPLKVIEMIIKLPQYQTEGYTLIEGVN